MTEPSVLSKEWSAEWALKHFGCGCLEVCAPRVRAIQVATMEALDSQLTVASQPEKLIIEAAIKELGGRP